MQSPVLSLITGTRNRPHDFRRLVDSIEAHTNVDWELVVSDASDSPLENEEVATEATWPRIRVIPERPRLGYSKGFNQAFRAARGAWVIFLNDDAEVCSGYAETSIRFMESHPEIGLGALYYSDPNHVGFKVNTCSFGMLYANFGIIRRTLGNKIGWFDERIVMYGGDNTLAYRVLLAGKGIAAIPDARIIHNSPNDAERHENNSGSFRQEQSELMKSIYRPHLEEMRAVYEQCRLVTA